MKAGDTRSALLAAWAAWDDRPTAEHTARALIDAVRDHAAAIEADPAIYEQPLNRDQEHTFTGRALAEMLRGEG